MERAYQAGDECLLFSRLPFDFSDDLPIHLLGSVYLDETPDAVLQKAPKQLANFVLPGYGLASRANCCLHWIKGGCNDTQMRAPSDLFFVSIHALRLRKPLPIQVAGQFRLGVDQDLIEDAHLFHLTSSWQPKRSALYDPQDIAIASEIASGIAKHLIDVENPTGAGRFDIESAVVYFSQITTGLVSCLQLAYVGLWSALEALFVPKGDGKAKTLATRVSRFLPNFDFSVELKGWIESEYAQRRNRFAHGQHRVSPWTAGTDSGPQAFGRLHEITRLCLLGFLSMDEGQIAQLQSNRRGPLQCALNNLQPASGHFLEDQVPWLE